MNFVVPRTQVLVRCDIGVKFLVEIVKETMIYLTKKETHSDAFSLEKNYFIYFKTDL